VQAPAEKQMDHGRFVWYELTTTDVEAAKAFYADVIGWGAQDASTPDLAYTLFTVGGVPVSGLMGLAEDAKKAGARPRWTGYVGVDDVDATADRIRQLGGTVLIPPTDIPNVSRYSVVTDPQMAALALVRWHNRGPEKPSTPGEPGRVGWHELFAGNWEQAFAFYRAAFDWQKADTDYGPMGAYQMFSTGGQTIGGMFTKPPEASVPFWLYYFDIGDIDAAAGRVRTGGGQILEDPLEVPGGWIVRCIDPQHAMFALMGKRSSKAVGYFARSTPRDPSDPRSRRWNW
jgi:uncharacterized protein